MYVKTTSLGIILMLMLLFAPCVLAELSQDNQSESVHNAIYVNNLTITLYDTGANATLDYELDVFTKFYFFVFGGGAIEAELKSILMGFDDITTKEISEEKAVFYINDITRFEDGFNVLDSRKLNQEVGNLTVEFPDGTEMRYRDIKRIPKIRYLKI